MKALTLWQPWASLCACGAKMFETRSWGTTYRGELLIHAAARRAPRSSYTADPDKGPVELPPVLVEAMIEALGVADFDALPRGAVLAVGRLAAVERIQDEHGMHATLMRAFGLSVSRARHEWLFGDFAPGRFAWRLEDVRPLDVPIRCAGARGLWQPDGATIQAVERPPWIDAD
jgi:hypothetical protein